MDDERLDKVLESLAKNKPRAPSKLVKSMVYTVNRLSEAKLKNAGKAELKPAPEKKAAPRQRTLGQKPPGRTL